MRQLIGHLQRHGKVLTEHIGLDVPEPRAMTDAEIYERDVAWLRESDLVVAEVTAASLGVGYELALAEALGKKHILCLYNNPARPLSAMIAGCPRFLVKDYATLEEALKAIDKFMEEARL
jgi:nucleoside 2-deoxyribosyltransferase